MTSTQVVHNIKQQQQQQQQQQQFVLGVPLSKRSYFRFLVNQLTV